MKKALVKVIAIIIVAVTVISMGAVINRSISKSIEYAERDAAIATVNGGDAEYKEQLHISMLNYIFVDGFAITVFIIAALSGYMIGAVIRKAADEKKKETEKNKEKE